MFKLCLNLTLVVVLKATGSSFQAPLLAMKNSLLPNTDPIRGTSKVADVNNLSCAHLRKDEVGTSISVM